MLEVVQNLGVGVWELVVKLHLYYVRSLIINNDNIIFAKEGNGRIFRAENYISSRKRAVLQKSDNWAEKVTRREKDKCGS